MNTQQIAQALRNAQSPVLAAGPRRITTAPPRPDETWTLPGGTAWVYYGEGNRALTRPVILADGFNTGPSTLEFSWQALECGGHPLISELRRRGRDAVLLGFDERSDSIIKNAETAIGAIFEAVGRRQGDHPLAVGGFSMGGLVTRYALAKLENVGIDHQTALYWSYDSPHRGAWIPLSLQAFAHYLRDYDPRFSDQINSQASRQLLVQHLTTWSDKPEPAPERNEFLLELNRLGSWPRRPRLIGVANGAGSGQGNGIEPGRTALRGAGELIIGTDLRTQPQSGDSRVADLRFFTPDLQEINSPPLPRMEGAPGGTLEGFGILADALNALPELGLDTAVDNPIREHCFVPAVSAVAIRDIGSDQDLYTPIDDLSPEESELDEFRLAGRNEGHTRITEELCGWILDRMP